MEMGKTVISKQSRFVTFGINRPFFSELRYRATKKSHAARVCFCVCSRNLDLDHEAFIYLLIQMSVNS